MARELMQNVSLRHLTSNRDHLTHSHFIDQTNPGGVSGQPAIGTSATTIDMSGMTTPGAYYFKNMDATATITLGIEVSSTFYPVIDLGPGDVSCGVFNSAVKSTTVFQAKASAGTAVLDYVVYEA